MAERPTVAFNLAGGLLKGLTDRDLGQFGRDLGTTGIEAISALPLRAPEFVKILREMFPPLILVEDAWNPGEHDNLVIAAFEGCIGHLRRLAGDTSEPPLLQDTIPFPSRTRSEQIVDAMMSQYKDAHFGSLFIESDEGRYPGRTYAHAQRLFRPHHLSREEVLTLAQERQIQLLWDPTHPVATPSTVIYPGGSRGIDKEQLLGELDYFGESLAGVDINSLDRGDLEDLMRGQGLLVDVARQAKAHGVEFVRLELLMPIRSQFPFMPSDKRYLTEITDSVEVLKDVMDDSL